MTSPRKLLTQAHEAWTAGELVGADTLATQALEHSPDHPGALFLLGKVRFARGRWSEAAEMFERVLTAEPDNLPARKRLIEALATGVDLDRAAELAREVMVLEPSEANLNRLQHTLSDAGRLEEATAALTRFATDWACTHQPRPDRQPGLLLIAAIPKSASTSLAHACATALDWNEVEFLCRRGQTFGFHDRLIPEAVQAAGAVNTVAHCHLMATAQVAEVARATPWLKIAVHVRDPRQALLSNLGVVRRVGSYPFRRRNPGFDRQNGAAQLDWMIDNYLPAIVQWIEDWLSFAELAPQSVISITDFGEVDGEGQDAVALRVCRKAGLGKPADTFSTEAKRYRGAASRDWQSRFTPAQTERAARQIPAEMKRRFGWDD